MDIKRIGNQKVLQRHMVNGVEYLTFPDLTATGMVKHAFSTKKGGVSEGIYASMNFSYTRGDKKEAVDENYRRMAEALSCKVEDFVCSDQTHTTNIRVVTEADRGKGVVYPKDYTDVDGLITNREGIVLVTFYADCVPLFLVDTRNRAIGLSHSGWRGTVGRMGAKTVQAMEREYGSRPEDILVAIGPSICGKCYEVGEEVAEAFKEAFSEPAVWETIVSPGRENGKYQLDLWRANEQIFLDAGILPEHISITDVCTCCNPSYLFSHRASHGKRGNLAAFLEILRKN